MISLNAAFPTTFEELRVSQPIHDAEFHQLKEKVKLPSNSWHWDYVPELQRAYCSIKSYTDDGPIISKALTILSTSTMSISMGGKKVPFPNSDGTYDNHDQLSNFLQEMDIRRPCKGILNTLFANVNSTGKRSVKKEGDVFRAQRCK